MTYSKIVKLASGNVQLQDASDNPIKTLQPAANLELLPNNIGVRVLQWQGESTDVLISEIDFTRIDPASDVAFAGNAQDLMTLLGDSFFFELVESSFPDYPIGSYQSFAKGNSLAASNLVPNVLYGLIIEVKKEVAIESLSINVLTSVAGSAVAGIYKYTDDGTENGTWLLQEQTNVSTPFNLGIIAVQSVLLTTPVILEAGIYCFAINGSSNPSLRFNNLSNSNTFAGFDISLTAASYKNQMFLVRTYNAILPSSITPTLAAGNVNPLVVGKVI